MHRSILFILFLSILSPVAYSAGASISLPSTSAPSGTDRIDTRDGTSCTTAIAGQSSLEMGAYTTENIATTETDNITEDVGFYLKVTIPINAPKRIDCNLVYDLEIEKLRIELEDLRKQNSQSDELSNFSEFE